MFPDLMCAVHLETSRGGGVGQEISLLLDTIAQIPILFYKLYYLRG